MWRFDTTTSTWQRMNQNGVIPDARYATVAFIYNNKLCIFAGRTENVNNTLGSSLRNDLHHFDVATLTWTQIIIKIDPATTSSLPLLDSVGRWVDANGTLWIFSGRSVSSRRVNEMWAIGINY